MLWTTSGGRFKIGGEAEVSVVGGVVWVWGLVGLSFDFVSGGASVAALRLTCVYGRVNDSALPNDLERFRLIWDSPVAATGKG